MCGIVGKLVFSGVTVDKELIRKMADTIVYRGPDDSGVYTAPHIGLGQRRLSVIDLRHESTAPLSNENASVWVVFNGEIYNYRELRETLKAKGHEFRTESDTEVIVHLYEEYGTECVHYMRGMFAFAIWDNVRQLLFAARDRMGKKPFYYTNTSSHLIFASEIKAITADPAVSVEPNYAALESYLTFQYVPSPLSAFEGIHKLPPGHRLVCGLGGELEVTRYWEPPPMLDSGSSKEEIEEHLFELLRESIRMRMIADVSIGAFLSGGVDSGTVVALMAEQSGTPVKTFSIGFDDDEYTELRYARLVAERYGTDHHEFMVHPSAIEVLPHLVEHYNEPFADASALPTYYVSKLTREYVTVALSGDGGDECFAGYQHYADVLKWNKVDVIPYPIRQGLNRLVQKVFGRSSAWNSVGKLLKASEMLGARLPGRYKQHMSIIKMQEKGNLYSKKFKALAVNAATTHGIWEIPWEKDVDSLAWMMRHDQRYYLADCLMTKVDVASMANSLEVRCPLLDHKIVEYAATIPNSLKMDYSGGKVILKRIAGRLLPIEVLTKRKTGFGVPLAGWFKGELSEVLRGTLLDDTARKRGLFDFAYLSKQVEDQISGARDWSNRLWAILFLELWFRRFID